RWRWTGLGSTEKYRARKGADERSLPGPSARERDALSIRTRRRPPGAPARRQCVRTDDSVEDRGIHGLRTADHHGDERRRGRARAIGAGRCDLSSGGSQGSGGGRARAARDDPRDAGGYGGGWPAGLPAIAHEECSLRTVRGIARRSAFERHGHARRSGVRSPAVKPLKVMVVAGARPNFVKVAPILKVMGAQPEHFLPVLVHTGQHYDNEMSDVFFRDLDVPQPDHLLGAGSGTHAEQAARVMVALERVLGMEAPQGVVVVGDVNSTMAAAATAEKKSIRTAHVEAGLRSYDRTMPEEGNRIVTDATDDPLLAPCEDADRNLRREGIP